MMSSFDGVVSARIRWVASLAMLFAAATTTLMATMEILGSILTLWGLWEITRTPRRFVAQLEGVDIAATALGATLLLSLACSPLPVDWSRGSGLGRSLLGFVALKYLFRITDVWPRMGRILPWGLFPASLAGLYATYQHSTGLDPLRGGALVPLEALSAPVLPPVHATGFFSSSMTFGHALLIPLFLALGLATKTSSSALRWLSVVFAASIASGLFSSFQRGPWLGVIAGVGSLAFFLGRRQASAWILGFSVVAALILNGMPQFASRLASVVDPELTSNVVRLGLWRASWQMFLDHPLTGVGFSHVHQMLPEYYRSLGITSGIVSHAHNNVMDFLGGAGILGAVSYLAFSALLLTSTLDAYRRAADRSVSRAFACGLLAGQIAFFFAGLTECNFKDHELTHQLLFWTALVCSCSPVSRGGPPLMCGHE